MNRGIPQAPPETLPFYLTDRDLCRGISAPSSSGGSCVHFALDASRVVSVACHVRSSRMICKNQLRRAAGSALVGGVKSGRGRYATRKSHLLAGEFSEIRR